VHGLRTSFRTWAAEVARAPREVAEMALAHTVGNAVERAYARTDLLDQRRELLQAWADHAAR
jgi:integrase